MITYRHNLAPVAARQPIAPTGLLGRVEAFLRQSGMTATRFGKWAVHDPNFVAALRKGRKPRDKNVARVVAYLEKQGA